MTWRIETLVRDDFPDVHAAQVAGDSAQLGISGIDKVRSVRVYLIDGPLDEAAARRIGTELLADPVTETCHVGGPTAAADGAAHTIEVHLRPGVTDPVAESTLMAIADMGLRAEAVRTGRKYYIWGDLSDDQLALIAQKVLANDCIEEVFFGPDVEPPSPHGQRYRLSVVTVPLRDLDDEGLLRVSRAGDLFLNLAEMQTIQAHYRGLERDPTDIELEMLAQTWSEHCVHKTFRGVIELTVRPPAGQEGPVETVVVDNLLKSTIARATRELDRPWCISVFEDNAGVVEFDEDYGVCFKVETHNHPSAIEPYGGAATGIGGCIRDPMGTGLGAKPVANTDVFCFASPDWRLDELPRGVLHPRRVMKGVVGGVRDYGNRMGIPTVNGAIHFDDRYLGNPLVFCGNVGMIPRQMCFGKPAAGELIMVVGGRTGRDGIHGATFSSGEMTHEHETLFSNAVQIGNPIVEKKTLDTLLQARDEGLYSAITDCGAGGLSSAVGEMGSELGAVVELDQVPLKYRGLSYTEIWISEAQERMVIAVPPDKLERAAAVFAAENVEATVIGRFGNGGQLELRYEQQVVGRLDMDFLHDGLPRFTRKAVWQPPEHAEPELDEPTDYNAQLETLLSDYNVASKEWVIRQYDHEVQGGSSVKPLVGVANDGPGDAAVIRPRLEKDAGVALGCGICPQYSDIDPYWMALAAIDEAIRNVVAVGGRIDRVALLDNFCWGNCDKPDRLAGLVRAAQGCYDAAVAFGAPFISGKDSLNNEFQTDSGETINIPGTLLVSALTLVDDVATCVTMDAKRPGNLLLVVGLTRNELGGSLYYRQHGAIGQHVPRVDLATAPTVMGAVARAIGDGLVAACHDCSEGGLAVALAEMAFAGGCGMEVDLATLATSPEVTRSDQRLFSESPTRFVLEIRPDDFGAVAERLQQVRWAQVGKVTDTGRLVVRDQGETLIDRPTADLKEAWQAPLRW